jgi:hypothetical protein
MLVGWWATFWLLLFVSVGSFGALTLLMIVVWILVPPLTSLFIYSDT